VKVSHVDPAVVVALIALVGTVGNIGLTTVLNARSESRREAKRSDAQWARYKRSLAFSADELRDRLDNILNRAFLDVYAHTDYAAEAAETTLFRFAQYFGWTEVVRRYARDADIRHVRETEQIQELQERVARSLSTDRYGGVGIWREAQRAIGELMITREQDVIDVVGVAGFSAARDKLQPWMARIEPISESPPSHWTQGERQRLEHVTEALAALTSNPAMSSAATSSG
jgi:hypothetical protein